MKDFTLRESEVWKTGIFEGNNSRVKQKKRLIAWSDHLIEGGIGNKLERKGKYPVECLLTPRNIDDHRRMQISCKCVKFL